MTIRNSIKIFFGSIGTYLLVAVLHACVAPAGTPSRLTGSGGAGGAATQMTGTGANSSHASGTDSSGSVINPVPDAHADESGTRIKVQWAVGEDGFRSALSLWDSTLSTRCGMARTDDGGLHCVPFAALFTKTADAFSDAACTKAIRIASGCLGNFASDKSTYVGSCQDAQFILAIGTVYPVSPRAAAVYVKSGGSCVLWPAPNGGGFGDLGSPMPISDFVSISITTDP